MHKFLNFILCMLFSAASFSQKQKVTNPVSQMKWLIGSWEGEYDSKPFYEAWRAINDSTLINFKIKISGNDTIVTENNVIKFNPKGSSKREAHKVSREGEWKLLSVTDTSMQFANDTLKFANLITWSHFSNDHWIAVIKNPNSTVNYDLKKVPSFDYIIDRYISRIKR